jgi:REP element-mobilizing transposase RayT
MADKFRNRFRIATTRAKWWDYGNGSYFITICTRNRKHFFGEIIDGEMYKSQIGEIAEKHWNEIPDRFQYAKLGAHIIMPNHIHGIVNIRRRFINFLDAKGKNKRFDQ